MLYQNEVASAPIDLGDQNPTAVRRYGQTCLKSNSPQGRDPLRFVARQIQHLDHETIFPAACEIDNVVAPYAIRLADPFVYDEAGVTPIRWHAPDPALAMEKDLTIDRLEGSTTAVRGHLLRRSAFYGEFPDLSVAGAVRYEVDPFLVGRPARDLHR